MIVVCRLCQEEVELEAIVGHLRGAHGFDIDVEEWPDGSPVVVDDTLEPADFERPS